MAALAQQSAAGRGWLTDRGPEDLQLVSRGQDRKIRWLYRLHCVLSKYFPSTYSPPTGWLHHVASWRPPWLCSVVALALISCSTMREGAGIGVCWMSRVLLVALDLPPPDTDYFKLIDRASFSVKYGDTKCVVTYDKSQKLDGNGKCVLRRFGLVLPLEVEKLDGVIPTPVIVDTGSPGMLYLRSNLH